MSENQRIVLVNVKAMVPSRQLYSEDRSVQGVYRVYVPAHICNEQAASIALDAFHESVAVKVLDDFDISVFDAKVGRALYEAEDAESYANGAYGDFDGMLYSKPWRAYSTKIEGPLGSDNFIVYAPSLMFASKLIKTSFDNDHAMLQKIVVTPLRNEKSK